MSGVPTIDEKSDFGKIHMYKSWYDRLFEYNKAQLLLDLCREQGYDVCIKELDNIGKGNNLKDAIELHDAELKYHTEIAINNELGIKYDDALLLQIYCNIGNDKFSDYSDKEGVVKDKLNRKLNYLGIFSNELINNQTLKEILMNDEIFEGCVRSLPLYYKEESIKDKQIDEFTNGLAFIEKDNRVFKRIELLKWIETKLTIKRFEVHNISLNEEQQKNFVEELRTKTDLLPALIDHRVTTLSQINKRITTKLDNLTSLDRIQKSVADIYNMFDQIILYDATIKKKKTNKIQIKHTIYKNFRFCNNYHKTFIKYLNSEHVFII